MSKEKEKEKQEQLQAQITQVEEQYSCYEGKLFVIPDKKKWIITLCFIQIPTIIHEIFHLQWFSHLHYFGALYVLLISQFLNLWAFMNLCLADPGFIQRIKYGYEIDEDYTRIPKNQNMNNHFQISYVLVRKQQTQKMKLCSTCNIYRPLRTSHCGECGVCVERMDHHCPWVGTCIGKKNYAYFYLFIFSLFILIATTIVMCIMVMVGSEDDPTDFGDRLKNYPFSIILVLFPCIEGFVFVGILLGFHTYLLIIDQTTKQFFDEKWLQGIGNPERKTNCIKNFIKIMFTIQRKQKNYKHKAFPYYNAEPESSSNTNNKHSKSQDQERRERVSEVEISEQNLQKNHRDQLENRNNMNVNEMQSFGQLKCKRQT